MGGSALHLEGDGEVGIGFGVIWLEPDGCLELGDGFGEMPQGSQGDAELLCAKA